MKNPRLWLTRNIYRLLSYGIRQEDVGRHAIFQYVSQVLRYSCHYWAYHFTNSESDASETEVFLFLKELVLHWLNAMSLMDFASKSIDIINILPSGLGVSRYLTCHVLATKGLSERHRYRISGVPAGC